MDNMENVAKNNKTDMIETIDKSKVTLGEIIKYFRTKKGLTQEKLGEITAVSQGHILAIEGNKKLPSYETLKKIVIALNIPGDYIFRTQEDNNNRKEELIKILNTYCIKDLELSLAIINLLENTCQNNDNS